MGRRSGVNLTAVFRLSRACLKGMLRKRQGRIIGISSIVGVTGNPGQGNYAAAKAGMIGMYKSLAAEVASRNVTVNCIAPGFIESPMTDALNEKQTRGDPRQGSRGAARGRRGSRARRFFISPVRKPPMSPAKPFISMVEWQ